jgi:DNA ligase (NAD+)
LDNENKINQLIDELNKLAYEYYVLDNPSVSDVQYDRKYDELNKLEKETGIFMPNSPTQRVGDVVLSEFQKYTHKGRLWSLNKGQNIQELIDFDNRCKKIINEYNSNHDIKLPEIKYVLTKKFDGLTINCTYDENGMLARGATRGTGEIGEDITPQIKTIKSIPIKIQNSHVFEVHGEAIMTKKAFAEYNNSTDSPLKNLRNGAAGALRNLNTAETAKRNLSAFFYDIGYNEGPKFTSYIEMMTFIKKCGFPVDEYLKICNNISELKKEIEYVESLRDELQYDIDGVVIVIDDIKSREVIGYTIKFPKWAIAYKFEALEVTTKLTAVEWNVGRSGRVTPTALLESVELGGVTVSRATLNNMDDIVRKKVRIGCDVFVRRSNDVIPEIMGVVEDTLPGSIEIFPPKLCPYCQSELTRDGVHYFCENTLSCKPQMVKSIVHFGKREAMNIEGFSEKTAEQLFEELNLKSISDLYRLKKEDLLQLERFGEKKAQNLISAIEESKNCSLPSFIFALGIPNVGRKTASDLVKSFKTLDKIENASLEELIEVQDVGEIVAKSIIDFFKQHKIRRSIDELLSLGVSPEYEEKKLVINVFLDKTVVVTGTLNNYSRNEIKEKLEAMGARVSTSVSSKTDYVLCGSEPGSKYDKALKLNVKVLSEDEFISML